MAVTYRRLFHLLIDKDMSVSDLQKKAGYSANISTKLKNDSYVSLETIEKICRALHCDIEDIVELKENRK
ncbi:MAG: helix-turn-helix transcriptional regulator [Negativicoccus succinicivorans]|uniref:helix-turn-helix domain-containing protein n=1 Tax=Negativicoccus succinicivorans TaxID=620903 RepID=UPI0007641637|nr:helix-turn-helix transcriptional regulator [Negativicoccus succinicivorans]MDU5915125.1 helix-turn-helix transcriptional regulator [Negativicoccus succinicivorans]